ncbi:MAG: endolytic transglycosylase MltG, partial [bacterium]
MGKHRKAQMKYRKSIIFFLAVISLGVVVTHIYIPLTMPIVPGPEERIIEIPRGMSIDEIAHLLRQEDIITSSWLFKLITRFHRGVTMKAGEYQLNSTMNMLDLFHTLREGRTLTHKVTVPEGFTISQIAELLADHGLAGKERFIETANDCTITKEFGIQAETLEGYLFPDTYFLSKGLSERFIIKNLVERFFSLLPLGWEERCQKMG